MTDTTAERIAAALEQIVVLLAALAPEAEPEPTPQDCVHPMEARADFGMTNGLPEWECRICGYRSPTTP